MSSSSPPSCTCVNSSKQILKDSRSIRPSCSAASWKISQSSEAEKESRPVIRLALSMLSQSPPAKVSPNSVKKQSANSSRDNAASAPTAANASATFSTARSKGLKGSLRVDKTSVYAAAKHCVASCRDIIPKSAYWAKIPAVISLGLAELSKDSAT